MEPGKVGVWIGAAGAVLLTAVWALRGGQRIDQEPKKVAGRVTAAACPLAEAVRLQPADPEPVLERTTSMPFRSPPTLSEDGPREAVIPEEERRAEQEWWGTILRLLDNREEIGWPERRRRIVGATAAYLGFDAGDEVTFQVATDRVAAEIEQAEMAREAGIGGIPAWLGEKEAQWLAAEIEARYQARKEEARGRIEELAGGDEKGRRFIVTRLEEWLAAVERTPR